MSENGRYWTEDIQLENRDNQFMKKITLSLLMSLGIIAAHAAPTGNDFLNCSKLNEKDRISCDAYINGFLAGMIRLDTFTNREKKDQFLCPERYKENKRFPDKVYEILENNKELRNSDINLTLSTIVFKEFMCL